MLLPFVYCALMGNFHCVYYSPRASVCLRLLLFSPHLHTPNGMYGQTIPTRNNVFVFFLANSVCDGGNEMRIRAVRANGPGIWLARGPCPVNANSELPDCEQLSADDLTIRSSRFPTYFHLPSACQLVRHATTMIRHTIRHIHENKFDRDSWGDLFEANNKSKKKIQQYPLRWTFAW